MRKTYIWPIVLMLIITGVYAEVTISGDARVRPRLEITDNREYGNHVSDCYYYYRARLLLSADIGDGYFFKTRLGHNGVAYWIGKFGEGDRLYPNISVPGAGRGSVDFMELYFGHNGDTFGWSAGIIPVAHNPMLDIHFYPTRMVDIPWLIFNNGAAHGFDLNYKIAGNKLDVKILVDNNVGRVIDDIIDSLDVTTRDQYTINASYPIGFSGLKMTPQFLMTIADDGDPAPISYGASLSLPKIAGFGISADVALSNQTVSDTLTETEAYSGWIARVKMVGKVGPGVLTAWYDVAQTTPDVTDPISSDFSYLWLSYTYILHQSDKGTLSFAPTYRLYNKKIEGSKDYTRAKIELTTQITFK